MRSAANSVFTVLTFVATSFAVVLLVVLLWKIAVDGLPGLSWDFLKSVPSRFPEKSGIYSPLMGSLWVIVLTGLISIPIGIAAGIYLEEMTNQKNRVAAFIQINISNLAGVPSIVYGMLGLALFVRWMDLGRSVLSGALTLSLLILPMLITVTQEALRAVPGSLREASYALGATQLQTIRRQVLPNAASGIFTGIILSLSRAMGETAPLIMVGAVAYVRVRAQASARFVHRPSHANLQLERETPTRVPRGCGIGDHRSRGAPPRDELGRYRAPKPQPQGIQVVADSLGRGNVAKWHAPRHGVRLRCFGASPKRLCPSSER